MHLLEQLCFLAIVCVGCEALQRFSGSASSTKTRLSASFLGNMFGGNAKASSPVPAFVDKAPSWSELDVLLRSLEPVEERREYEDKKVHGRGGSNHKANLRLFDAPDGFDPTVTLYRDQAAWCPYCEKVWLQLEEKRIPYKIVKNPLSCYGDKSPEFFRVSPSGQLPVAEINGRLVSESNTIMSVLEEEFPSHKPLLPPAGSKEREKVPGLLRLERRVFGSWFSWLTSRAGGGGAAAEMHGLFLEVDAALQASGGPYFLGSDISFVDVMFTPFLERMAASLPYFKGFQCRCATYPHLLKWYEAMDTRPAYVGIKSDYYSHVHDLPPQIGGCHFNPESAPFREEIDGGAWDVAKDASECLEPMLPADPDVARRDAARQLLDNAANVVKFACRGAGAEGRPKVRAELADPRAVSNLDLVPAVDCALRHVVSGLLAAQQQQRDEGDKASELPARSEVEACLIYLRNRVGVPRDMTVHGARQLRAHINHFVSSNLQ